ncbi:hypothetical protein GOARA_061_00880 [Gordonia araii NBRC 100433]|uniref:Uncharacterized protein n=1 Tax=Gordonia araii NBRC 100433 TaxID=1073574 RepID=G7H474_9ACTN|nr:hypothetical protein [Gordonia araii]NNG96290.1 hypothetical protein [Gordonia araii NBRC 100433]GAB10649.1 hypothetical protein GOARA_061_00880 [Gordonia araii NBRC 100433]
MTNRYPDPPPTGRPAQAPVGYPPPPTGGLPVNSGTDKPKRRRTPLLAALGIATLIIGIVGAVVAIRLADDDGGDNSAAPSATVAPSTPTATATATAPPAQTGEQPAPPPRTDGAPAAPKLPAGAKPCPGARGVATHEGRSASCAFAASVRTAYLRAGKMGDSRLVNGWAPQERARVPMNCRPRGDVVICRGGTDSIVYIY